MRLGRNHEWGHPAMIDFIQRRGAALGLVHVRAAGAATRSSLAIALLGAGTLAQVFARSIREVQGEGHVEVARARGLSPRQVLTGHVLRNASLPVYTLVGILVGGIVSGDKEAYDYLSQTIAGFLDPQALAASMREGGLEQVRVIPLSGGIVTIHHARTPLS